MEFYENIQKTWDKSVISTFQWSVIKSRFEIDDVGSLNDRYTYIYVMLIDAPKNTKNSKGLLSDKLCLLFKSADEYDVFHGKRTIFFICKFFRLKFFSFAIFLSSIEFFWLFGICSNSIRNYFRFRFYFNFEFFFILDVFFKSDFLLHLNFSSTFK